MLRDFAAAVRARRVRFAVALAVASIALAATGCGIKGPLRPATPPAPAATEMGPPLPPSAPDPNPEALRKS